MATTIHSISLRRGLEAERQQVILKLAEPAYCTDSKQFYIGDGETLGGVLIGGGTPEIQNTTIVETLTPPADAEGQITIFDGNAEEVSVNVTNSNHASLNVGLNDSNYIRLDWSYVNGPKLISNSDDKNLKIEHNDGVYLELEAGQVTLADPTQSSVLLDVSNANHASLNAGADDNNYIGLDWSATNGPRLISNSSKNLKITHNGSDAISIGSTTYIGQNVGMFVLADSVTRLSIKGSDTEGPILTLEAGDEHGNNVLQLIGRTSNTIAYRTSSIITDLNINSSDDYVAAETTDANIDFPGNFNIGVNAGLKAAGQFGIGYIEPVRFTPYSRVESIELIQISGEDMLKFTLPAGENMDNIKAGELLALSALSSETLSAWNGFLWEVLSSNDTTKEIITYAVVPSTQTSLAPLTSNVDDFGLTGTTLRRWTTFSTQVNGRRTAGMTTDVNTNPGQFDDQLTHNRVLFPYLPVAQPANAGNLNFVSNWQLFVDTNGFVRMNLPPLVRDATTGAIVEGTHATVTQRLDGTLTTPIQ